MSQDDLPPLRGFKYLRDVSPLLERLRPCGTERDASGNREFFFDQYAALLLLYFFNPALTSMRGLAKATELRKVRAAANSSRVSLGSLSEAPGVFDPGLLRGVLSGLAGKATAAALPRERAALRELVAVDGSLIRALPGMAWALWQGPEKAAKLHLAFEVFRGPADATLTHANGSERAELLSQLARPGKVYVLDRGYEGYELLARLRRMGSSFVARVQNDAAHEVARERPVNGEASAVGVVGDVELARLGTDHHKDHHKGQPIRMVVVELPDPRAGEAKIITLLTDRLDWPAELVALAYRYRWSVELFFRWLKCILGCRHLLSHSRSGVAMQVYCALIASVLLGRWSGVKPDKRTYEMFCHYFSGWASEQELRDHLDKLQATPESSA